jgi:hypothetical protein
MYQDFHFYIDLNWEDCIAAPEVYLKKLYKLVELAYQHKASVFYSPEHLEEFKLYLKAEDKNFDDGFCQSMGNKLDIILANAKMKRSKSYIFELCFSCENTSIRHIDSKIASAIDKHDKIALLSSSITINSILSVNSNSDYDRIECKNIKTSNDIVSWISALSPRTFNVNPKHGENGAGNLPNASILLCSREKAQILLNDAIPCFLEREKNLYNFDSVHNTFIEFFFEGNNPQNQWHGFHLKTTEWNKVPDYIRKYFGK